jgi:glycosyltransferase involved in cell wall biosynthesis
LLQNDYNVSIYWRDQLVCEKIYDRFGIDIRAATINTSGYKALSLDRPDLLFWVSDGSIPTLTAKKNILHFQVPFSKIKGRSLTNSIKFKTINHTVCNSEFTKNVIDKTFAVNSEILYPPCQMIEPDKKEKIILAVGRFDGLMHNKRQDILINNFKKLQASGWRLVMAGGDMGETNNLTKLKQLSVDLPIEWVVNPPFDVMNKLYATASLFWHAAGFGVDEVKDPELVEHFGMSTVEAMSAGAVPLVYAAGGQKEIVREGENGCLWLSEIELVNQTNNLINDPQKIHVMSQNAQESSQQFSQESFVHAIQKLLS